MCDYCTGALDPASMAEVEMNCLVYPSLERELAHLKTLLHILRPHFKLPQVKENFWDLLENINRENTGDLHNLPVLNQYSDYRE